MDCKKGRYEQMKASVIIPVFNETNLDIILKSLQNQQNIEKASFEVIIVNDGGRDLYQLENHHFGYPIKYVEHEENLGRSVARNTGARHSESDFLIFMDGDRIPNPEFIVRHINAENEYTGNKVIIGNPIELLCPDIHLIRNAIDTMFDDGSHKIWKYAYNQSYAETICKIFTKKRAECYVEWAALFSANFSIKKELYWQAGGFDENYCQWGYENMDFGIQLQERNIGFYFLENNINLHIFHKQNRGVNLIGKEYILDKYKKRNDIVRFFDFLDGNISLYDFTGINDEVSKSTYFSTTKFGSKYKYLFK